MKIESVKLYQAVQVGLKLETFLNIKSSGVDMDFSQGLLTVTKKSTKTHLLIPTANIMYMTPAEEEHKESKKK